MNWITGYFRRPKPTWICFESTPRGDDWVKDLFAKMKKAAADSLRRARNLPDDARDPPKYGFVRECCGSDTLGEFFERHDMEWQLCHLLGIVIIRKEVRYMYWNNPEQGKGRDSKNLSPVSQRAYHLALALISAMGDEMRERVDREKIKTSVDCAVSWVNNLSSPNEQDAFSDEILALAGRKFGVNGLE
jgi:hypothetical protein